MVEPATRRKATDARTDDDISDDAAGIARGQLAAASKERKEAEQSRLAAENARLAERRTATRSKTDDSIDDEAAGIARAKLAAESQARREGQAATLRLENAELERRREATGARTDDDIGDDAAGIVRGQMAAASKARREQDEARLAAENALLARRRGATRARTDDDISDEAAGIARAKFAAASKARREKEAQRLAAANAELARRLREVRSRTNDGDGGSGPTGALEDRPPLERGSDLHIARYLRFQANEVNRQIATETRLQKVALERIRAENAEKWAARGRARAAESRSRQASTRKLQRQLEADNKRRVRGIRREEAEWEELRLERQRAHERQGRMRVLEASTLDTRLDASEAAQDAKERAEGSKMRTELAHAAADVRLQTLLAKQRQAAEGAATRAAAMAARAAVGEMASARGTIKREEAKVWEAQKLESEVEYLTRARENRKRAQTWRRLAKRSLRLAWKAKVKAAVKERANDHLVTEEKNRIREANRREVQDIYRQRFVDAKAQAEWERSPMARLQRAAAWGRSSLTQLTTPRSSGKAPSPSSSATSSPDRQTASGRGTSPQPTEQVSEERRVDMLPEV